MCGMKFVVVKLRTEFEVVYGLNFAPVQRYLERKKGIWRKRPAAMGGDKDEIGISSWYLIFTELRMLLYFFTKQKTMLPPPESGAEIR
jgi:hypothetical protein